MSAAGVESPVSPSGGMHAILRSRSALLRHRMVLAAVVIGVVFGALSCAVGMGVGGGHSAHASGADRSESHVVHSSQVGDVDGAGWERREGDGGGDQPAPSEVQSHPGMACVVSVDLRFPEPALTTVSDVVGIPAIVERSDCVVEVEPPVPRIS